MAVFVLGKTKRPLMPCSEKRARKLLQAGRAVVHRLVPFTIGNFNIRTGTALVQGISHRHCRLAQRADGYGYFQQPSITKDALPLDPLKG